MLWFISQLAIIANGLECRRLYSALSSTRSHHFFISVIETTIEMLKRKLNLFAQKKR